MKKQFFLVLAASAWSGAVCAQANVSIYGSLDQYLGYIKSSSGNHIVGLNDGTLQRSRLGFRGTEDLGGGYHAKFNLEMGLNADSGTASDTSRIFDRQAWVSLQTPVGELRLGRQNSEAQQIGDAIDYTQRTTFGSIVNNFGVPSRYDNDVAYISPRVADFRFAAHYALTETVNATSRGVVQLAIDYTHGPYRAGYAGVRAKPVANALVRENVVYHNAYANYNYGRGKIYLAYVRSNNATANANGLTAAQILGNTGVPGNMIPGTVADARRYYNIYQLSFDYQLSPQLRIGTLYGVMRDTSGGDAGARGGNVGAMYALSKRTQLYAFANHMRNDSRAGFRFSGSGGPSANLAGADVNGKALTGLQAGIVFRF